MSIKRIVQKIWLVAFITLAFAFAVSYVRNNRGDLTKILDADVELLGIAALAQILYFFVTVLTWQKLLECTTNKSVSFGEGLTQVLLVNFGKYIPGKIWGLTARGTRLAELSFTFEEVARASILEQFLLIICGSWLAALAAFMAYNDPAVLLLLVIITPTVFFYRTASKLVHNITRRIHSSTDIARLFHLDLGFRKTMNLSAGYLMIWLFLALTFIFFCHAFFSTDSTVVTASVMTVALTTSFLAGFIAIFAPGGIGVREGIGAAILAPILSLENSILLMLLFRLWTIFWEIAAATAVLSYGLIRKIRSNNETSRF